MGRAIALATLVAGTLDILWAVVLTLIYGREPAAMLRYVASGPLPGAVNWGAAGSLLGLAVHFTLIAVMAAAYVAFARRRPHLLGEPAQWGILYGLATYFIMNWMVVPLRFETPVPTSLAAIATQLFAHIVLVGLPIAFIARRLVRPPAY